MTDKDNRIRLDQTPVDFDDAGLTGQDHDIFPAKNSPTRYDQMRSYLIGLLSNQSSEGDEPFEKRTGTLWYNKTSENIKIYDGSDFVDLSQKIGIDISDSVVPLQTVIDLVMSSLEYAGPRVIWSGYFSTDEINKIPIPSAYQGYAAMDNMGVLVYVDGMLIDPRSTVINAGHTYIDIGGGFDPDPRQSFTVILQKVTSIKTEDVIAGG